MVCISRLCTVCSNNPVVFANEYAAGYQLGTMCMAYAIFDQEFLCDACLNRELEDIVIKYRLRWINVGRQEILLKESK